MLSFLRALRMLSDGEAFIAAQWKDAQEWFVYKAEGWDSEYHP